MWINPNRAAKNPDFHPDTVVFDMDGVLIDNSRIVEFDNVAVRFIFTDVYGLDDSGVELLTRAEVAAFKQAGGFNDDFDLIYAVTTVYNAVRLDNQIRDTATLRRLAPNLIAVAAAQKGGLAGLLASLPQAARPDWTMVQQVSGEIYWGAEMVRQKLGIEPRYTVRRGMVEDEQAFAMPELMEDLAALGLHKWGIITGRIAIEMDIALSLLPANLQQPPVRVTGDMMRKPDPAALVYVVQTLGSSGGYYIGDTADDLRLVQYYEALRAGAANPYIAAKREERTIGTQEADEQSNPLSDPTTLPPFRCVMIARPGEEALWQARNADAIINSVNQLPLLLRQMGSKKPHPAGEVRG